jgi:hypothetical protein
MFQALHLMFEAEYNELALAVDLVAEQIRALGFPVPGTYKQFSALSSIPEDDGVPPCGGHDSSSGRGPRDGRAHVAPGVPRRG